MARIADLIQVHLKETEAIIAQSNLLLQKRKGGQSGELKSAGNIVEEYIKSLIVKIAPSSIKVTSGYIVDPRTLKSDDNLPQHDIILTHAIIPPLFSIINDKIEVIPIESMVGIIEVKRTLTKDSLKDSHSRILHSYNNIIKKYKRKDADYKTFSVTTKPGTIAPLFGIMGLESNLTYDDITSIVDPNIIDFIWALNHNEALVIGDDRGITTATVSRKDIRNPRLLSIKHDNKAVVFSKIKGILTLWLSTLASQWMKAEHIRGYYIDVWNAND